MESRVRNRVRWLSLALLSGAGARGDAPPLAITPTLAHHGRSARRCACSKARTGSSPLACGRPPPCRPPCPRPRPRPRPPPCPCPRTRCGSTPLLIITPKPPPLLTRPTPLVISPLPRGPARRRALSWRRGARRPWREPSRWEPLVITPAWEPRGQSGQWEQVANPNPNPNPKPKPKPKPKPNLNHRGHGGRWLLSIFTPGPNPGPNPGPSPEPHPSLPLALALALTLTWL